MSDWAAGWYQDPENQGQIRYWDGNGWTDHRQATPDGFDTDQPGPDASGTGTHERSFGATSEVDEATRVRPSTDRAPETEAMPADSSSYGAVAGGAAAGYGASSYGQDASYGQAGYGQDASYGQAGYGQDASYGQAGYGQDASYGQAGYGQQGAAYAGADQYGQHSQDQSPKSKSKLPLILGLVGVGFLLVLALGIGGYFLFSGDDEASGDDTTSQSKSDDSDSDSDDDTTDDSSSDTASSPTSSSPTSTDSGPSKDLVAQKGKAAKFGQTLKGNGNATVKVPPGDGAGLIVVDYKGGDSTFKIDGVDGRGKDSELIMSAYGDEGLKGTYSYNLTGYGASTAALDIETGGSYTIRFEKLSTAPKFGTSQKGEGSTVLQWDGKKSDLAVKYTLPADESFGTIRVEAVGPEDSDSLVSEYDSYEGTTTVQDGTEYIVIEAGGGEWELTKK